MAQTAVTGMTVRGLIRLALLALAAAGLAGGIGLHFYGEPALARLAWTAGVVPVLAALLVDILAGLRRGEFGLDIVAALSMTAALAFGETLAAAVVALMYAGGAFLERFAEGRARREMQALLARVPRTAWRYRTAGSGEGGLEEVPLDHVAPGDRLMVRQGDVVPVDGRLASPHAFLDTSALTGESLPLRLTEGDEALSGATNAGAAFDLLATHRAAESTFAGIVRLVDAAQSSKAPMARLADRWSLGFLALTLTLALGAWWATGDPIRAVAVLVVATPCPLILAVPVALVAGLSRAAQAGVLVKGAGPLEAMTRVRTLILDKTGTLTEGRPDILAIEPARGPDGAPRFTAPELLRLAAGLEQASPHPMARALVASAQARGLTLPVPGDTQETPGEGLIGQVEGYRVAVGGPGYVARHGTAAPVTTGGDESAAPDGAHSANNATEQAAGAVLVAVAVDGHPAGDIILADRLRPGTPALLAALRAHGIARLILATGDRPDVARRITEGLGLDALHAGLTPEDKLALVRAERRAGPVMMVGDGVNDAPALALANVGVAMGARGAAASAEAADVVLLVDRLDRLAAGISIARGARRIALQSVGAGIGLSALGMVAAAFGLLSPVEGALLQEAIDVATILNALRALRLNVPEAARSENVAPG